MGDKLLCRIALESGKVVDGNDRVRYLRAFTFNRIDLSNELRPRNRETRPHGQRPLRVVNAPDLRLAHAPTTRLACFR